MEALKKMNEILNKYSANDVNTSQQLAQAKTHKKCTCKDPILEPMVKQIDMDTQNSPKVRTSPRVLVKATNDKPYSGPITHSKIPKTLIEIMKRDRVTNLVQVVLEEEKAETSDVTFEVFDDESGQLMMYRQLISHPKYHKVWSKSAANKFGFSQRVGGSIQGTNTTYFVHKQQVPADQWKDITYAKFVIEVKPNKAEVHHTQLTVGDDKVHYPDDVGTPTAGLTLVRIHLNSVVSTAGAKF